MGNMNFIKGMGAGIVVGACIGMAVAPDKKSSKKALSKAAKAIENLAGDVADMIGL